MAMNKTEQGRLDALILEIKQLREQLAERDAYIQGHHPGTNVVIHDWTGEGRPLPRNSQISFKFSDSWDDSITVYHEHARPGKLYVSSARGMLAVYPRSGNAVHIGMVDR